MKTYAAVLFGILITLIGIFCIPLLLTQESERSSYYWYRIAWSEFLALLVWSYIGVVIRGLLPIDRKKASFSGSVPATGFALIAYAVLSLGLMMSHTLWGHRLMSNRVHMAGQIALFLALVIVCVFIFVAKQGSRRRI